jgi:hypothetical protein
MGADRQSRNREAYMMTTAYPILVVGIGVLLWLAFGRRTSTRTRGAGHSTGVGARQVSGRGASRDQLRAVLIGANRPPTDLVAQMAHCLAERTTMLGSIYAVPGYLGAALPKGVFEAASAAKPALTAEVLGRFTALMNERARRLGRAGHEFALPGGYVLRLVLTIGPTTAMVASFSPIVDVHAEIGAGGGAAPEMVAAHADLGETTRRRPGAGQSDQTTTRRPGKPGRYGSEEVVLTVDGMAHAQRHLDDRTSVLSVGRGSGADLRTPEHLSGVSRLHVELTYAQRRVYVEDKHAANGTWLQRCGGAPELLVPGEMVALQRGDVVWLDEDHRAKVAYE